MAEKSFNLGSLFREAGKQAKAKAEEALEVEKPLDEGGPTIVKKPNAPRIFNILEYIESPWGLGFKTSSGPATPGQNQLFPVQRFIIKLYYNIPLDDDKDKKTITITDMLKTKVLYTFTEREYLQYLYNEGRCNIGEQDHERRELVLACGRRSGKTTISGICASYEVYRLLNLTNPQAYYGLPPGNRIQIISIATDKDQAGLLFKEVSNHVERCDYFSPYKATSTQSEYLFRTPHDIEKFGDVQRYQDGKFQSMNGKASIRVTFKSCVAKGLRGSGNIMIILDEMAHFIDQGQSSAKDIYDAITPSMAAFAPKDPDDPTKPLGDRPDSRVICISSPLNKSGKFWDLFQLAMSKTKASDNLLAIQAPTWEVNPTVLPSYYEQKYHADPRVFMTEHGAHFSDRVRGWIERESDLMECVDPTLRPLEVGYPRAPHQMGIDLALSGDGTAFVITYLEGDQIVLAYHELWEAGKDWRESNPHLANYSCPYARTLSNVEKLDFDEIANWIEQLTKRFYITDGLFDRWNGPSLEQTLHKKGLTMFKSEFFTRDQTSKMFQTAKILMLDHKLKLYDYVVPRKPGPLPPGVTEVPQPEGMVKHSPLISEILSLQAEQMSKNVIVVAAPEQTGCHDDQSDALIRAIWLSYQRLSSMKVTGGGYRNGPAPPPAVNLGRYQMQKARMHGGFSQRVIPRNLGIRLRGR